MGDKPGRTRQHILHFFTISCILAAFNIVSCAQVQNQIDTIKSQKLVSKYRSDLTSGFFETVIQQSKQVLKKNDRKTPADVALYALGEAYVHHDFEGKDYELSKYYFDKLIKNFPDSPLTSEAKTFVSLFDTFAVKDMAIATLEEEHESVSVGHKVVDDQNFKEAVKKNLLILEQAGKNPPRDGALYNLGLIYAHIDNQAKDFKKSQSYFQELAKDFPNSPLAEEARIWLGLFQIFEKMQQIDLEIEQQKKQLTR